MAVLTDLRRGARVSTYTIESVLGRGAASVVYAAVDERLGRRVALKLLAPTGDGEGSLRERFLRESRLAASIDHPNVIPIYEAGEDGGLLYIAMRLVPGSDLRGLLRREGRLDPEQALAVVSQAASALDAAHARGLLHRDVKPGNILLGDEAPGGHVYLSDFGLAIPGGAESSLEGGRFHGTAEYAAPEQIEGRPGPGSDVYSLACVLFECLAGEPPFGRGRLLSTLWAHLNEEPPRLSERRPGTPPELDEVLASALAKEPGRRPATAGDLVAAARAALGLDAPRRAGRSRLLAAALLGAAAVATALVVAVAGALRDGGDAAGATISTFAGTGVRGFSGDGGPALEATLGDPRALAVDRHGDVYVADQARPRVRRVDRRGVITTVAGTGEPGYGGDGGPAARARISDLTSLGFGPDGLLYIVDAWRPRVRRVEANGRIRTVVGDGRVGFLADGPRTVSPSLCGIPIGPEFDEAGRLYLLCPLAHRVVRVEPDGSYVTVAGTGEAGYSGDGGPATAARLNRPEGIAIDSMGNLYIADTVNHRVRKVDRDGRITTFAGTGRPGLSGDGWRAAAVDVWRPIALAVDGRGNVYVVEAATHRVRMVDRSGTITTVAGTGTPGFSGDGGPAAEAALFDPVDIAVGTDGAVYIADRSNQRVRVVRP